MEFDFDVGRALGSASSSSGPSVARVDDASLSHPRWGSSLRELLDKVGERSKRAQGLGKAVTGGRLGDCRVYLMYEGCCALGLLKVGVKRLFVSKGEKDGLVEISPLCVLDFYVVEGHQRGGFGKRLFGAMLAGENISAEKLAYDRPSPKLIGFLRKHFGLAKFHPQANHYVVFDAYFGGKPQTAYPELHGRSADVPCPTRQAGARQSCRRDRSVPLASLPSSRPQMVASAVTSPPPAQAQPGAKPPLRRRARSSSPFNLAGQSVAAPSSLIAAMAQGLRF